MSGLGPEGYQTFRVSTPLSSHWREATCTEVGCARQRDGFTARIDEGTDLGAAQAYYIRHDRTRSHREERDRDGLVLFHFPPGTKCFARHRVRNARPELYLVLGGDARGNPRRIEPRRVARPEFWTEEMTETVSRIETIKRRG